jgi:two-component sensor histidine kinase
VITQLEHEVGERKRAEAKLAQLNEQLEVRVAERTGELQAANAQLAAEIEARTAADERMRSALKEKTTLLNEVHHRVKNNLQIVQSLVDLQATQVRDPVVRAMLEDTKNRIHSMALIHQTLYESKNFARIDASSVLNTLVSRIVASYNIEAVQLNVNLNVAAIELPLSVAIPCGLIVNELVTNALKHAFAGRDSGAIDVALIDRAGRITLSVSDNGGGLVQPLDIGNVQTLGLELVTLLADQLGGELSISPAGPTCFSIEFPLAQE